MLLILALLVFVPCLALLISFLLSPGGKSGGNKKNDGVKVSSAPERCAAGALLGSLCPAGGEHCHALLAVGSPCCAPGLLRHPAL